MVVPIGEILWEDLSEHLLIDFRRHRKLDADIAASLPDLADLSRHEEATLRGGAFLGQQAPPSVDDVAEIGARSLAARNLIGESGEDTLGQRLVGSRWGVDIEALSLRKSQELLVDPVRLASGIAMDGKLATLVGTEVLLFCPAEGACRHQEIRPSSAEEILPLVLGGAVGSQEQGARLSEGGHERRLPDTAEFLRSKQHPCVAGMCREGEHPSSQRSDDPLVVKGTQIPQQRLGPQQRFFLWGVEPPDRLDRGDPRCLEG